MAAIDAELNEFGPLLDACLQAFFAAGGPAMPEGRRQDVIALLTNVMADPDLFDAYRNDLIRRRSGLGREGKLRMLNAPRTDIPGEQILAEGFAGLTDAVLADLATSPEGLQALDEVHFHGSGNPGRWFFEAINRRAAAEPDAADQAVRISALNRELIRKQTLVPSSRSETASPTELRAARRPWLQYGAVAASLAASFLVGIFLGPQILGEKKPPQFAFADAGVRGDTTRGIEDIELFVTNGGKAKAFVTVVGLIPGNKRAVLFNGSGGKFVTVTPGETVTVKNLPPEFEGSTVVVLILTNVPAGDAVRASLPSTVSVEQAGDLAEQLRRSLTDLNIRTEVRTVLLPTSKE